MPEEFGLQIGDLPEKFREAAFQTVKSYVTALAVEKGDKLSLIGSGTFVQWNNHFGILTAEHVTNVPYRNDLKIDTSLGSKQFLHIVIHDRPSAFGFKSEVLTIHSIRPRNSDELGPDLSVIELPQSSELETIKAVKSFWNLTNNAGDKLARALDKPGCMAIAGHPGEDMRVMGPVPGFEEATFTEGLVGLTGEQNYFRDGAYDYLEVESLRDATNGAPLSYSGVSGGSLWRVPITRKADEDNSQVMPGPITFAGVPFYQFHLGTLGHNRVRGHGPVSVYTELIKHLPA